MVRVAPSPLGYTATDNLLYPNRGGKRMKHRYPKVSEDFKCLAHDHMLLPFTPWSDLKEHPFAYKSKPRFRYRTFSKERALAFDGMRQACLADKPDMDNLYVKYYLAYLHEKWETQRGKLD